MQRNQSKKMTEEDKFSRKFWVHNRAKRSWIRKTKRENNKKFRKMEVGGE